MAYRDGQRLRLEADGAPLRLSVNRRARRVSIRIDARAGEAVLVAPSERRLADAVAFARTRADWIRERLADRAEPVGLAPGQVLTVEGRPVTLAVLPGAGAARLRVGADGGEELAAGGEGAAWSRRILNFLKRRAREALVARTEVHCRALGLPLPKVSINDPRSRWGSCTPGRGTIRYSWRVILAPPAVLDYLAAHEVAHLVHADHSPRFWAVVAQRIGDPAPHRAWLKQHGAALHALTV